MNLYNRQEKLRLNTNQSISVVGCGGIGFWVCKFAAMSGIQKIYAFDHDIIDETNLNRLDLPRRFIGKNKAEATRVVVNSIREECSFYAFPFKMQAHTFGNTDWIVDCTDNHESQIENQKIAKMNRAKYFKAGYDGENFGIHNKVAEWGEAEDGYQVIPSWVVPATMVASLAVAKILKYNSSEVVSSVNDVFNTQRGTVRTG